jgi:serine/threonine-protein kinase
MNDDFEHQDAASRVGMSMGGYRLESLLGSGGMAAVYLGRRDDGEARAIKVLHPQVARDRNLRARFAQEVEAVSRLQHPGIVRTDDMGAADDGSPYIIMELLEGETLHDRLSRGLPTVAEALDLVDALLDILAVAHQERIIHRDIKPDNLFLSQSGLKVLDFGIAKVQRESVAAIKTKTGTALGTPSYMAQEQIKGVDVDHRADLFAAGAVLLKMTTGRRVHEEPDPQRRTLMMLTTPAPPTKAVAPHLSDGLCDLIDRALAFEPADRYPDARTMQGDVHAVRQGEAPPYASAAPPISVQGPTPANAPPAAASAEPTAATRVGPPTPGPAAAPAPAPIVASQPRTQPAARKSRRPAWLLPLVIVMSVLVGALIVILVATL